MAWSLKSETQQSRERSTILSWIHQQHQVPCASIGYVDPSNTLSNTTEYQDMYWCLGCMESDCASSGEFPPLRDLRQETIASDQGLKEREKGQECWWHWKLQVLIFKIDFVKRWIFPDMNEQVQLSCRQAARVICQPCLPWCLKPYLSQWSPKFPAPHKRDLWSLDAPPGSRMLPWNYVLQRE